MGISKIRDYKPYKGVPISRNFSVAGEEQVYLGYGINCGTFWFRTVKEARKFIDKYRDKINPEKHGLGLIPEELCKKCQHHYSFGTKEWEMYPPHACKEFKERLKRAALES